MNFTQYSTMVMELPMMLSQAKGILLMSASEIARLRQRIQEEYEAAQHALYAPAIVAKHEFITKRMENMQEAHVQLQAIVGEHEAIKLIAETLDTVPEVKKLQIEPL